MAVESRCQRYAGQMPTAPLRTAPEPPLRDRKRARTRERIIAEGLELFLTVGFDATTVADIAAAAEVSPATVFRYFGTKEALLFANHEAEEQALCQAVRRHRGLPDPRSVMAAAVVDLAGSLSPDDEQYAARIRVITSSPVLLGAALRTRAAWEAVAAQELAAGTAGPDVADTVAAGAAVGALHAGVSLWFVRAGAQPLTDCVREALAALWPDVCGSAAATAALSAPDG